MEKNIKCKMNVDKSISITINNENKIIIRAENRQITAKELYELFDFNYGDHYTVENEENNDSLNVDVLTFFNDLMKEIARQLNNITHQSNGD